jgi:hypothetical protein
MGVEVVMQTFFDELVEPWRNFPRTVRLYAVASVSGALALTLIHVFLPGKQEVPLPNVDREQKIMPEDSPTGKEKVDVISSWEAVKSTNDIVELNHFITRFPSSQFSDAAWDRMDQLIQRGALKVAGETEGLDILSNALQHDKDKSSSAALRSFINYYGFNEKYPLGFALFYSDGSRVLYSGEKIDPKLSFDPANIKVLRITPFQLCFSGFAWNGAGAHLIMDNDCVSAPPGSRSELIKAKDFSVAVESLGVSPRGAAWVIGIRKPID